MHHRTHETSSLIARLHGTGPISPWPKHTKSVLQPLSARLWGQIWVKVSYMLENVGFGTSLVSGSRVLKPSGTLAFILSKKEHCLHPCNCIPVLQLKYSLTSPPRHVKLPVFANNNAQNKLSSEAAPLENTPHLNQNRKETDLIYSPSYFASYSEVWLCTSVFSHGDRCISTNTSSLWNWLCFTYLEKNTQLQSIFSTKQALFKICFQHSQMWCRSIISKNLSNTTSKRNER